MAEKKPSAKESPGLYGNDYSGEALAEWIEGIRYEMKPSPAIVHQVVADNIQNELKNSCKPNGVILSGPVDVYFNEDNVLIPDVVYISNENLEIVKPKRIEGAPDLVVEVLSPGTSKNDRHGKKAIYEKFGVKEYWIVDAYHYTIEQFLIKERSFHLHQTYSFGDVVTSPAISCVRIHLDRLFEEARLLSERFNEGPAKPTT